MDPEDDDMLPPNPVRKEYPKEEDHDKLPPNPAISVPSSQSEIFAELNKNLDSSQREFSAQLNKELESSKPKNESSWDLPEFTGGESWDLSSQSDIEMAQQPRVFSQEERDDVLPQNPAVSVPSSQPENESGNLPGLTGGYFSSQMEDGDELTQNIESEEEDEGDEEDDEGDEEDDEGDEEDDEGDEEDDEGDEEPKEEGSNAGRRQMWGNLATNYFLDAAKNLNKPKFYHDDWEKIAQEVKTKSGKAVSVKRCNVKLNNLIQKYNSECKKRTSKWQFFGKVEILVKIMPKETPEKFKWSDLATNYYLDAAIKLNKQNVYHNDWKQIAEEILTRSGEAISVKRCKAKLGSLSRKYKSECKKRHSKWQFFRKVEILFKITRPDR